MVDDAEWHWISEQARGGVDHLLIASSLPVLLPPVIHHVEGWNEAVCAGAWGRRAARVGERIRRGADLEHWAAFRSSLDKLVGLVTEIAAGLRGEPPATVVFLSGDVHFAYLAEADFPASAGARSAVYQAVCSPIRNPIPRMLQRADRFAGTRFGQLLGRALARSAGVRDPEMTWRVTAGPWFENEIATLDLRGRWAQFQLERSRPSDGVDPQLDTVLCTQLSRPEPARSR